MVQATLPQVAGATALVIGLFALLVWTVRREVEYGLFFLVAALYCVRNLHYHLGLEPLPIPEAWFGWLTVHSLVGLVITVNIFGLRLHGARFRSVEWPLIGLAVAAAVLSIPGVAVWRPLAVLGPVISLFILAGFALLSGLGLWSAWRARSRDSVMVLAMNMVSVPAAVHDVLLQNYRLDIERLYVLPLMGAGLFASYMLVMVTRYVRAIRASERAHLELEDKLREREDQLTESHRQRRAIEHEQILGQERQRLMQDMHDGLGSSLMGALKAVEHGHSHDIAGMLRECIDDLKLAIDSLEPVQADLLLLLATLRYRLGTRLEQAGVRLSWQVEDVPELLWLDPGSALNVLRILQEVLGNVVKHSGATDVTLTTRRDGADVVVGIEDNGGGMNPIPGTTGRGLANVKRRADALGATARWRSGPGGTRFELVLPIDKPAPGRGAATPPEQVASGL